LVTALKLETFLEKLNQARELDDIQNLIVVLRDHYSVKHIVYRWVSSDGERYSCGTYDPVWVQRYMDRKYLRVDPVVIGCFQRFHPIEWKRLDWSSKKARELRRDAIAHGIGDQGYSVPARGPNGQFAILSISTNCNDDDWAAFTQRNQRDFILIAHYFNKKALDLTADRTPDPPKPLSPREVDTLTFLAMGYGRAQVAEMLSISEHTLRAYIESGRFKLGAINTTHAVARAMSEGLILIGGSTRAVNSAWPGRATIPPREAAE
jgi:DNA-binding CsgD family transcriptional regulator